MIRTATGKELALQKFYHQIAADAAARPEVFAGTVTALAKQARIGKTTLFLLLGAGVEYRAKYTGRQTWKHVLPLLSVPALFYLKQCSAWNGHAAAALAELLAVHSTNGVAEVMWKGDFGSYRVTSRAGLFPPSNP